MTITNHVTTGALIAAVISQPLIALPLAFMSHFVLDALPHFGYKQGGFSYFFRQRLSWVVFLTDISIFVGISVWLLPDFWWAYLLGLVAVSPDFIWGFRYLVFERRGKTPWPNDSFTQLHAKIQTMERPWGILIEIVFAVSMLLFLYSQIGR